MFNYGRTPPNKHGGVGRQNNNNIVTRIIGHLLYISSKWKTAGGPLGPQNGHLQHTIECVANRRRDDGTTWIDSGSSSRDHPETEDCCIHRTTE